MIKLPPFTDQVPDFLGERFVPGTDPDSEMLHYHRYLAATGLVRGKQVLDIASGEGFGSWFLAQSAAEVTGVDISAAAVAHATRRYGHDSLRYFQGDCRAIPLPDASVDVVVSFETLEHISEHEVFMTEIQRVLRPGGVLLISTPDLEGYNASMDVPNAFHERELSRTEFVALLHQNFGHVALYEQSAKLLSVIWPEIEPETGSNANLGIDAGGFRATPWFRQEADGIVQERAPNAPVIRLAVASDAPVAGLPLGGFLQTFPHAFPISAIEGGAEDRQRRALAAARAETASIEQLTTAARSDRALQFRARMEGEREVVVTCWDSKDTKRRSRSALKRKLKIYKTLSNAPIVGSVLQDRLASKVAKYERLLAGPSVGNKQESRLTKSFLEPLKVPVLDRHDQLLLRLGSPHILAPGAARVPDVSVVIPVYNQCTYTLACLFSLVMLDTRHTFEVIVVDDCSSDETADRLPEIPWLHYLRQPVNGGFIASCNAGLAASRGRYVLFLNNDTEVLPGWLDELVNTFDTFPDAGLVGSKLLYPDGSLQECGGILWRDGSAWNFGRNQDPREPQFCYARQVDYCSGASIMLPRDLMLELGGFDTYFAPAYCEDSDLAMRVRQVGRTVMVQPLSRVVHYEGITSGTDTSQGIKAYQVANGHKLYERWKEKLALRPENADTPSQAKDFGVGKRLLVVDEITPETDRDAGSVTCFEIMRAAQVLGFQITFIPASNFADLPDYTARLQRIGIEAMYGPYCTSVKGHLAEYGARYDAILVYRVGLLSRILDDIRAHAPQARLVYQTSDLHHLREARQAEIENSPELAAQAADSKAKELYLVGQADATIVHSLYEKEYLSELVPGAQIEVFNWIVEPKSTDVPYAARSGMLFLGGYNHTPNVDAVYWFLDEIWPLIAKELPEATFHVIGSNMPDAMRARASDRVKMTGFVKDLHQIMSKCVLSIVPLRYGAGTKGKLAMSLAYGLPAVTTSIGAEGMGLVDGEAVYIADDPPEFARRVVHLYRDAEGWARMSQAGLDYVDTHLSRSSGTEIIRKALLGS